LDENTHADGDLVSRQNLLAFEHGYGCEKMENQQS
jgi:hypothetical protein